MAAKRGVKVSAWRLAKAAGEIMKKDQRIGRVLQLLSRSVRYSISLVPRLVWVGGGAEGQFGVVLVILTMRWCYAGDGAFYAIG